MTYEHVRRARGFLDTIEAIPSLPPQLTIVLAHGYGANAADLFSLHQMLAPKSELGSTPLPIHWIFPEAPLDTDPRLSRLGRAWFELDLERLQRELVSLHPSEFNLRAPASIKATRGHFDDLIRDLCQTIDPKTLILGGFSQGSMIALDAIMRSDRNYGGALLFSTSPFHFDEWKQRAPAHARQRYFQSHGKRDSVLSYISAQQVHQLLQGAGWSGQLHAFPGAHEIPVETIALARKWLGSLA